MCSKVLPGLLAIVASAVTSTALAGVIILFERQNFQGTQMALQEEMANLDQTTFNDRTESIVVREGFWEVCTDAFYRGICLRLGPGDYPNLSREFTRSISSLREVGAPPPPPVVVPAPPPPPAMRAVLYEFENFGGRQVVLGNQVVQNFDGTGFNDRASSLVVEGGYWVFCSDAYFQGTCRTFGPGQYPRLPGDVSRRISSGRRIADQYPYDAPPNWQR